MNNDINLGVELGLIVEGGFDKREVFFFDVLGKNRIGTGKGDGITLKSNQAGFLDIVLVGVVVEGDF